MEEETACFSKTPTLCKSICVKIKLSVSAISQKGDKPVRTFISLWYTSSPLVMPVKSTALTYPAESFLNSAPLMFQEHLDAKEQLKCVLMRTNILISQVSPEMSKSYYYNLMSKTRRCILALGKNKVQR